MTIAGGALEMFADALGAYPLYRGRAGKTHWLSNSAELVRDAVGSGEIEPAATAGLIATGWSLSWNPLWAGVHRITQGAVLALDADGSERETHQLPLAALATMIGGRFDPDRAARRLTAALGALTDWPGRPAVMQLSGGRDSRVLAAAAAAGGVEAEMRTTGTLDAPDVQLARQVTDVLGLEHRVASPQPDDGMHTRLPEMARWLALTGGGAISLEHAAGYFSAREGPLPLWVNGQGGEIARAYYGSRDGGNRDGVLGGLVARVAGGARLPQ